MTRSRQVVAVLLLGLAAGAWAEKPVAAAPAVLAIDAPPPPPPPPLPRARPITAAATVNTPVCLGFAPDGQSAYVLTTNNDPGIPEWYLQVQRVHDVGTSHPERQMLAKTRERAQAQARFAALVKPINALIRESKLVACTAVKVGQGRSVATTVGGIPTKISYADGNLVIAARGRAPVVRPETETVNLSLVAVYTVPRLPAVLVVLRDNIGGGFVVERAELVTLESGGNVLAQ